LIYLRKKSWYEIFSIKDKKDYIRLKINWSKFFQQIEISVKILKTDRKNQQYDEFVRIYN
jgi:hypothetical protein